MSTFFRIIVTIIAVALLGAVIWRWETNGWASLLWVTTVSIITIIRAPYARRAKANAITDQRAITMEYVLLTLVSIGGTFLPLIHLATGALGFANFHLPDWPVFIGAAFLAPGVWLFWRSHADLGRNWSVTTELREAQDLVTSGVYKHIRHPMYAAIWLLFLPQPLFVQNWIAGLAGPVSFAIMYFIRVPYEEQMMRDSFGEAYNEYCQRTGRLFPK